MLLDARDDGAKLLDAYMDALAAEETVSDPDELISFYERVDRLFRGVRSVRRQLALRLASFCKGEKKTQRVRGKERQAAVKMPDDYWDQSVLKEAWHSYPQHREEFLSIDTLRVRKREFKKLLETACPKDLSLFRQIVSKANLGPSGTPRITVEK